MERASRRTRIVRVVSMLVLFAGINPGWGSPGDVLETEAPILGGDVPKSRDLAVGDASVSTQTGALTYSFALAVPPGRLVEPSLALTYSSSAPLYGSPVGAGWSIAIPEIRYDPSQSWLAAQTPSNYTQRYVSSLAGGNRLIAVSEPAPPDTAQTYRAQFDNTYARYELITAGHWRVRMPDGLTHHFGEFDHMADNNDPTWAPLTRTVDPFGNTVDYFYFEVRKDGGQGTVVEFVLDRIEYTANPAAGIGAHAQVDFTYSTPGSCGGGTLGDLPVGARFEPRAGQVRWSGSRRLDSIVTRVREGAGWRDVRTVTLGYDEDADGCGLDHGPIRLLTSIQESARSPGGTVVSKPAITFGYGPLKPNRTVQQPFNGGFVVPASPIFRDSLSGGYRPGAAGEWPQLEVMLLDLDADGRLDRLFAANMPEDATHDRECAFIWQRNEGDGFAAASAPIELPTFRWGEGSGTDEVGDCSLAGQLSRYENTPACVDGSHYLSYRFVDINGDQLPELVAGLQYQIACLDLDPFSGPSPIPPEWGWDPDRVCPESLAGGGTSSAIPPPPGTEGFSRRHLDQCGEYLWLIYWNQGGGVIDVDDPTPIWSPIPLESNGADTGLGGRPHGFASNFHAIIDIDGDGLVDVLTRENAVSNDSFLVFRGNGGGAFLGKADGTPYLFEAPPGATTGRTTQTWVGTGGDTGYAQLTGLAGVMDLSGDGLPDLLLESAGDGVIHSHLNLGNRFQYSTTDFQNPVWNTQSVTWSVTQNAVSANNGTTIGAGDRAGWLFPLDWDEDGRLDIYRRTDTIPPMFNDEEEAWQGDSDDQAWISTSDGGGNIAAEVALPAEDLNGPRQYLEAGLGEFRVLRDFIDLNGDGATDYVEQDTPDDDFFYTTDPDLLAGKPLRLLNRIDNGAGGITDIRYRASTDASAIDIPGTDDTQGMPTHTWLVDTITRTDVADALGTTGTLTGTTTYRYGRPIFNQARYPSQLDGQYAFRGFERVRMTSPLGAVTESVYDYSLDWSGRMVETTVYESASALTAGTPDSIEQTTWQALTLFCPDNGQAEPDPVRYFQCDQLSFVVPVMSFQPVDRKTWTCADGQSRATCQASGALRVETTTWLGKPSEEDPAGIQLLHHPFELWRKGSDEIQTGDRLLRTPTYLYSGVDYYRLRPFREARWEQGEVGVEFRGKREHTWIPAADGRPGAFEERVGDLIHDVPDAMWSTEFRYQELGLGLVTGRKKPHQFYSAGPRNTIAYEDAFKVHPTATTNEKSHRVETVYDLGTGALLSERGPNSVACGTGCVEYEGTRTEIDGFGRPVNVFAMTEDPGDNTYREILVQRFTYRDDVLPRRVTEERRVDWNGAVFTKSHTELDGFGRVQERVEFRFDPGKIDAVERFRYDAQGNIDRVQLRDPSLDTSASVAYLYDFDALNRPLGVERPNGSCVRWTYDGLVTSRREVASNCPDGGMTADPEAATTTTNDVFGRLVQVDERIDGATVATTLYAWDANDNLERVESPDGIVTLLEHDWMNRRTSITRGERNWAYTYDRNGNLIAERSPVPGNNPVLFGAYTTTTGYDSLDRPTSRMIGAREIDPSILDDLGSSTITFTYDQGANGLGRLTSVSSPTWSRSYEHDARGNVIEDSLHFDLEPALGVAIEDTRTRVRTFNPLGGVVDEWHGDGTTLSGSTHTTTSYNRRGLPATLTWQQMTPVVLATATRNGAGLLKSLGAGAVTQSWTHDTLGRVTSTSATSTASGQPTISEAWTYYATDDPHTLATSRTGMATRNFTFSFDDRHQLENAFDDAGYAADFSFTAGGRLATAAVASVAAPLAPPRDVDYVYPDPQDADYDLLDPEAVRALAPTSGGFSMQYGFDLAGNVTTRTEGGGSPDFTFLYDGEDQQRIATAANGDQELYYYDHNGQRLLAVSRQPGGTVTKVHLWLGSLEVEYDGSNSVTQTLAHLSLEQPVARIENRDTAKRVVHGQLGNFLGAFTSDNSALDVSFVYGPFGEILAQSGADPADYTQRFNGKEQDALTSLSYYGARYFDPLSLTWTQADPLYRFAPDAAWDQPRRANLYSFSLNNPLRYLDPDGLSPAELWRDLNIPGARDRPRITHVVGQINATSTSSNVRANQSLAFLATSLGLPPSSLPGGFEILRNLTFDGKPADAITVNRAKVQFDLTLANPSADVFEIALVMTTLVHEFVHVEGGDEAEAYRYEKQFLDEAFKRGFLTKDEYTQLNANREGSISTHLEGKGGGKQKGGDKPKADVCEECIRFGLNPDPTWNPYAGLRPGEGMQ
jgi:RHS repeat-associated protein